MLADEHQVARDALRELENTDEDLMNRVKAGELRHLETLFERYHAAVFRYCLAIGSNAAIAEDCVQEAFRRVLQYRDSYASGRFRVWLFRIARNAAMDLLPHQPLERVAEDVDEAPGPDSLAEQAEDAAALRAALGRISPAYREVIVLARFQELGSREIGLIVGAEDGAVRVRMHRAMKALAVEYRKRANLAEDHHEQKRA